MSWIWYILLGALSGWLTQKLMNRQPKGFFTNFILGAVGGLVGSYVFKILNISPSTGKLGFIITAVVGAVIVVWIADKLRD